MYKFNTIRDVIRAKHKEYDGAIEAGRVVFDEKVYYQMTQSTNLDKLKQKGFMPPCYSQEDYSELISIFVRYKKAVKDQIYKKRKHPKVYASVENYKKMKIKRFKKSRIPLN